MHNYIGRYAQFHRNLCTTCNGMLALTERNSQGKSGSGRVAYVDFAFYETIYLITAYPKKEKDNLSKAERNAIAKIIIRLEQGLKEQENKK